LPITRPGISLIAVDGNADILVLKHILGHASVKTTELYIHPSINTLRKTLNNHLATDILNNIRARKVEISGINRKKRMRA
jgi:hypothetical protein